MSYGNTDVLPLMYNLMGAMTKLGLPVVFKGAMVLNTLTNDSSLPTRRLTEDVDGDWVDTSITNIKLFNSISQALQSLGNPNLYLVQTRQFSEGRSAGFAVKSLKDDDILFTLDIRVKNNQYSLRYALPSGVVFWGSHLNKIYCR